MATDPKSHQRAMLTEDGELKDIIDTPQSRLSSVYCIHCGTANRPEARFCYHCGQSFEEQTVDDQTDFVSAVQKAKRTVAQQMKQDPALAASSASSSMAAMEVLTILFVAATVVTVSVTNHAEVAPFVLIAWLLVEAMRGWRRR